MVQSGNAAVQGRGPEFEPTDPIGRKLWEQHALVTPELARLRQEDSRSHWLASLPGSVSSRFSERPCLKDTGKAAVSGAHSSAH